MKTLYLLRHAKSSWEDASISDFDRPLNERGRRTAPLMGRLMRKRGLIPEVIISSPAKRAKQTTRLLAEAAGLDGKILFDERIYEASPMRLQDVASGIDDKYASAMLVGHNPGIEGFIRYLTGALEPMPTTSLAVIELDIRHWADADIDTGSVKDVYRPKDMLRDS